MTVFRAEIVLSVLQQLSDDEFAVRQLIGGLCFSHEEGALILTAYSEKHEIIRPFGLALHS